MFGGGFGAALGSSAAPASSASGFSFSSPFGGGTPSPSPFGAPQSSAASGFGNFGGPQSSSSAFGSFGTPQSSATATGGGFGFGTPQSSASLFGGFGAPQSSASAFGGFGQPQSSASAFGFGAPQSSASAFGGFGQPQSSASAFGFGTPQSSAAAFGFGTPQPSLFGGFGTPQSSASALSFGGYGQSSSTSNLFGAAQQQPQQQAGGFMSFGTPGAGQPQTQLAPVTASQGMQPSDPAAAAEVEAIATAFGLSNNPARMRFTHLFLNVVDNPAARHRPPNVDALRWRQAVHHAGGEHNKHHLWPVPAHGFGDLLARKAAQDQALQEHEDRMKQAQRAVAELVRKQDILVHASMDKIRREHQSLSARLLSLMRKVDALEARSAGMLGLWDDSSAQAATAIAQSLDSLEARLAPAAPSGLQRRVDSLAAAAHLRASVDITTEDEVHVTAEDLAGAYEILQSQAQAITQLQRVLLRVNRDVSILADPPAQTAY